MTVKQLWGGIIAALVIIVASNSLYVVKETQRGVLLKFGEVVNPNLRPGIHFKVPFVNNVRLFDGRILTVDSPAERFFTQEKKALIVDSYAKFRVLDTATYYTATNGEEARAAGLLAQRINDGLRNEVAVRTVQEVVSGSRDEVMESITNEPESDDVTKNTMTSTMATNEVICDNGSCSSIMNSCRSTPASRTASMPWLTY